jgi:NADH-dependent peroxiredoxin subunit F
MSAMLDATLKSQLGSYLERLTAAVEITAQVDDGNESREMLALLADITSLSPRITVREDRDGSARVPSFALARPGEPARIEFAGLPLGHEFTSLVLALLQVGGYPPKIDAATIQQIQALDGDYQFETFISLSCQNCPDVVQALNLLAVLNPRIRHTMIGGRREADPVRSCRLPQRRTFRPGPDGCRGNHREARQGLCRARHGATQ